ncbi:hypothetical protein [Nostoc commune]|nr:hypothetical protein [Nostoc commune]
MVLPTPFTLALPMATCLTTLLVLQILPVTLSDSPIDRELQP